MGLGASTSVREDVRRPLDFIRDSESDNETLLSDVTLSGAKRSRRVSIQQGERFLDSRALARNDDNVEISLVLALSRDTLGVLFSDPSPFTLRPAATGL